MRIISWNINSVRLRMGLLEDLITREKPDIIALQETKVTDDKFPFDPIRAAGMEHIHIHGMKSYNGVAILSRIPFISCEIHHRVGQQDCRHISVVPDVKINGKPLEIHTLYIPAGGDEPDPEINPKYKHKLDFLEEMRDWFAATYRPDDPLVALGDFNIAPGEHDVWSHKQLAKVVSHTPPEIERLAAMQASLDWVDTARHFIPGDEKSYSWWSYRNRDWKKSNRGRRLDHIWVTRPLEPSLENYRTIPDARDWEKPSDHVPIILDVGL